MEITVDGKQHFLLHSDPGTVGDVLIEINEFLQANGRVLQGIVADGRNVPAEEITQDFGGTPVSGIGTLDITSADQRELARESIDELAEVVPELPVACQQLSTLLAGDAEEEALEGFDNLLKIWAALKERQAQIVDALSLDAAELELEGGRIADHDKELQRLLEKARSARAKPDLAVLADVLAYDLSPLAEREADIIALFRSHL